MKMENELKAPAAGTVTAISAVPGQAVEKGSILLTIGE
jgi:biotin carboxyl carrier protein